MAEETPTATAETDLDLGPLLAAVVELLKTGTRPDVLEAQRVLLQRMAFQGDLFPSRVPPPRNITEVGGYLNLLESARQPDVRTQAIAAALGIAAPPPGVAQPGPAVGFVDLVNDRPAGPAQPSIPATVPIRADFFTPLLGALSQLHAAGCALPLRAPARTLPASLPADGTLAPVELLRVLGRVLEVMPGTVLVDPANDPVVVARLETPATSPFQLVARELDGGTVVPEEDWVAIRASEEAAVNEPLEAQRLLPLADLLAGVGWIQPQPVALPVSLRNRGTLVQFLNVTGLVAGETALGDELSLLHGPVDIARSALAPRLDHVWNGTTFAPPA